MREVNNNSLSIFLSVVGVYVVRTPSLNNKHSCQLFRMGLRDKITPISTTSLVRANMICAVATNFSSLAFLSSSVSMANLSRLVAASFSSLTLLSSSVSTANLELFASDHLLQSFVATSLQSFENARRCYSWFSVFLLSCLILSLSFFCSSVSEALFAYISHF